MSNISRTLTFALGLATLSACSSAGAGPEDIAGEGTASEALNNNPTSAASTMRVTGLGRVVSNSWGTIIVPVWVDRDGVVRPADMFGATWACTFQCFARVIIDHAPASALDGKYFHIDWDVTNVGKPSDRLPVKIREFAEKHLVLSPPPPPNASTATHVSSLAAAYTTGDCTSLPGAPNKCTVLALKELRNGTLVDSSIGPINRFYVTTTKNFPSGAIVHVNAPFTTTTVGTSGRVGIVTDAAGVTFERMSLQ